MTRTVAKSFLPVLSLLLGLSAASTASAGEAIEALRGKWLIESFGEEPTPPNMKFEMEFVDDDTLKMTITFGEESQVEEVRYQATADGKITVYPPETPEGEEATWEVKADKKLYITAEEGVMVLSRPS